MIYIFLADGFEECEAIAPIDILRRAEIEIKTVGVGGKTIVGAHGISVNCDLTVDCAEETDLDGIILPGGMPGTVNLENSAEVKRFIEYSAEKGLLIGAICAAPSILGHMGLLNGKTATCFTGFEAELYGARVSNKPCVTDGQIITAYGAGAAFEFGFALLTVLRGSDTANALRQQMRYREM